MVVCLKGQNGSVFKGTERKEMIINDSPFFFFLWYHLFCF